MAFYAVEIAECPGFGFTGGPEFQTTIANIANGMESRNADWAICRHKYTAPYSNISDAQYANIKTVFLLTRGRAHSFLFKDPADHTADGAKFGTGDGATTTFQLSILSTLPGTSATYTRTVTRPLSGSIIKANGAVTGATVSTNDGSVVFAIAPANGAILTWSGEFRTQVRFDTDYLPFSINNIRPDGKAQTGSVDLIEVLGEADDAT